MMKYADLDLISPYFVRFEEEDFGANETDKKRSGNDFHHDGSVKVDGRFIKFDLRVDNNQTYQIVEFEGFKYKVSSLNLILGAKMKYAELGQYKHVKD